MPRDARASGRRADDPAGAAEREGDQETVSDAGRAQLGDAASAPQACPKCGMRPNEWSAPAGYEKDGERYCCEGCAEDVGCVCHEAASSRRATRPRASSGPARRSVAPASRRGSRKSAASTPARRPPESFDQDTLGDEGGVGQSRGRGLPEDE